MKPFISSLSLQLYGVSSLHISKPKMDGERGKAYEMCATHSGNLADTWYLDVVSFMVWNQTEIKGGFNRTFKSLGFVRCEEVIFSMIIHAGSDSLHDQTCYSSASLQESMGYSR